MYCPACGKKAQVGALACARCMVIFSKWREKERAFQPPPPKGVRAPAAWGACVAAGFILFAFRGFWREWLWLLDGVNLGIHETGHLVFGIFGSRFLTSLGGTLLQLAMPIAFVVDFRRRNQARSSDACVAWVGQNLLHIGRYAADARAQVLPLVGGGEHDWTYLLGDIGLLTRDILVGQAFDFAGCCLIAWAGVSIWERTRALKAAEATPA